MDNSLMSLESNVRFYSRLFPAIFSKASGSYMYTQNGEKYLDFFCGSGSLNYGHNEPRMKAALLDYINSDGVANSLDQTTEAKLLFMKNFNEVILKPRNYNYKMQFCGPTGTNAIEAAIKLARKYTGRENILYFEHSFHGMSYGSMSVSGMNNKKLADDYKKNVVQFSYSEDENSIPEIKKYFDGLSKEKLPAAILLETVQAEGGMRVADYEWLRSVELLAKEYGVLLIVDDIQAGCGRTGTFFSFDKVGLNPDIVCLSKSLSGYGLPLSVNLISPEIDCWYPGEHNGTFRGNNLAFVTASSALNHWANSDFSESINRKSELIIAHFSSFKQRKDIQMKGRGLMMGLQFDSASTNALIQKELFNKGILMDTCGYNDDVVKIMPPINISEDDLIKGLELISSVVSQVISIPNHKTYYA